MSYEYIDEIHYGTDGSIWIHSDLWGSGADRNVTGLMGDVNWSDDIFDGVFVTTRERDDGGRFLTRMVEQVG